MDRAHQRVRLRGLAWRPTGDGPETPGEEPGVREILEASTLTLSTAGPAGRPFATPVFFAADQDLGLVFFSDPETLHVRQIRRRAEAAAAIYPVTADWLAIRGLQVAGIVERIRPGEGWERAWGAYVAKFPFVAELRALVDASWLLVLVPSWIRLIDNRRGFGFKREWLRGPLPDDVVFNDDPASSQEPAEPASRSSRTGRRG